MLIEAMVFVWGKGLLSDVQELLLVLRSGIFPDGLRWPYGRSNLGQQRAKQTLYSLYFSLGLSRVTLILRYLFFFFSLCFCTPRCVWGIISGSTSSMICASKN